MQKLFLLLLIILVFGCSKEENKLIIKEKSAIQYKTYICIKNKTARNMLPVVGEKYKISTYKIWTVHWVKYYCLPYGTMDVL